MGVTCLRRLACLALCLLALVPAALAATAIPTDAKGLPLWVPAVWTDFPVEISLPNAEAARALLDAVPLAAFQREDLRPVGDTPYSTALLLRTRVTEDEFAALEAAGVQPLRVRDREREVQDAIEATWAAQQARGGEDARVGTRGVYHTFAQIEQILQDTAAAYPDIVHLESIGQSVLGRELWTLRISDNVNGAEEAEPEVRLCANIHGNEKIAVEMSLFLLDYLTSNYGVAGHEDVTDLVNSTEILLLPLVNPDGHVANTRSNNHGVDLNRNFPVPDGTIGGDGLWTEEPETQAIKAWGFGTHCVISQDSHSGAVVVNYPWDYTYTLAPDNDALIALSEEYSYYNLPMWNGDWFHGITNGAQWYVTKGSMQDWAYNETGALHVIVELSDSYQPPSSQLETYWDNNRESYMHWIRAARYGVNGRVTDVITGDPVAATVSVAGISKSVVTDPDVGDYYKLLDTGTYTVHVEADGYHAQDIPGVTTTWGAPTVLDIQLVPESTGVAEPPMAATLEGSFPNPFNPTTTLRFNLAHGGTVGLEILDTRGRHVRRLLGGEALSEGSHELLWDGRDDHGAALPSGVYYARLRVEGVAEDQAIKLLMLK